MSNESMNYKKCEDFELITRNGKYLYVDYKHGNWFKTDEIGNYFINRCEGNTSINNIMEDYAVEFSFDKDLLEEQFKKFWNSVKERGVITNGQESSESKGGGESNKYPSDIWIHVTSECNLSCPFCYSNSGNNKKVKLKRCDITNFLTQIPGEKREKITISGGEPMIYGEIIELVRDLKEMKFKSINIISNGTMGAEKYKEILPLLNSIQISVDGTQEEIHDISRGKGSFAKMVSNIKLIKRLGVNELRISFTPTINNIEELPKIPMFAQENGVNAIHITKLMPIGRGNASKNKLSVDAETMRKKIEEYLINLRKINDAIYIKRETAENFLEEEKRTQFINTSISGSQYDKILYSGKRKSCGAGKEMISINYDGNIFPCASLHKSQYALGNIIDNDINDLYNSGKTYDEEHCVENVKSVCNKCKVKYLCGGGCRACADAYGDIYGEEPTCTGYKDAVISAMFEINI